MENAGEPKTRMPAERHGEQDTLTFQNAAVVARGKQDFLKATKAAPQERTRRAITELATKQHTMRP